MQLTSTPDQTIMKHSATLLGIARKFQEPKITKIELSNDEKVILEYYKNSGAATRRGLYTSTDQTLIAKRTNYMSKLTQNMHAGRPQGLRSVKDRNTTGNIPKQIKHTHKMLLLF